MRRRLGGRSVSSSTAFTWTVILIGTGALAATLPAIGQVGMLQVAALCLAGAAAHALVLPGPSGEDQTLAPVVAAAGLTLLGAPAAMLAAAVGGVAGRVIGRRRRLTAGLFAGAQWTLATLAAAVAAYLVNFDSPVWTHPVLVRGMRGGDLAGLVAAAAAATVVSVGLARWRTVLAHATPFRAMPAWPMAVAAAIAVALFGLGTLGALVLGRGTPSEAPGLAAIAGLVVGAALAYGGGRQTAEDLEVVRGAAAEVSRCLSVDEIGRTLAAWIDRLLPADIVLICARPPGEGEVRVVYFRGPGGLDLARRLDPGGPAGHLLGDSGSIRIGDYERDPRRSPRTEIVFGRGAVRSVLAVPLVAGRDVWGSITLARGERRAFSARHERLVLALADQAAPAIRILHLQEHARLQTRRLDALQHGHRLVDASSDPGEAPREIVERAAALLGAPYAFLALVDPQGRELRGAAAAGADTVAFTRLRAPLDGDADELQEMLRAALDRRPVTYGEAQVRASLCPSLIALPDVRGAVAVPVLRMGRTLGALMVARPDPRPFGDTEIATLEAVAAQGAALIDYAAHHRDTEATLRRTEEMVSVFRRVAAAQEMHGVVAAVADGARSVLGVDRCLLLVWDGQGVAAEVFASGVPDAFADALRRHLLSGGGRFLVQATRLVALADLAADTRMAPVGDDARRAGIRAAGFVPMRTGGEFVGLLMLAGPIGRDPGDARLAEALAEHAASAVRTVRLLAEAARRLDEMETLTRILGAVSTSLNLTEVYRVAATELADALGGARVSFYRVSGQLLRLVAQVGAPDAPLEMSIAQGVTGRAVRTGRVEFVANVHDDPDHVSGNYEVTSLTAVPIQQDGAVAGLLVAEGTPGRPVTAQHAEFLAAFARQLSVVVRNAAFYENQRRAHDELQVLYEAARAVSGTLELRTVLDSMVSVTCRAFGYDSGAIMLVDPDSGGLIVEAAYGRRGHGVGRRLTAGAGISDWVARTGTPLQADGPRDDAGAAQPGVPAQSELAVPLIAEGKVLGVFTVAGAPPAAFGPRDLRLLTTLASYAVVAIQNARLYEAAQRLAITDGLTELYNHRHLYESLERVLERARRDDNPVGLIMLEIDSFKRYNDSYGHQSGDEALRTVAALLRRGSRPSDIVARYGGDEFMVVLPGAGKAAALETAERIRRAVEAYPLILADEIITSVTLSVGVAAFPDDGDSVDALVDAVDRAQYAAKRSGGNKVHVAPVP